MRVAVAIGVPVISAGLMFLWGRSWDFGPELDCAMGTYFLADTGWAVGGMFLALLLGGTAVTILALGVRGALSLVSAGSTFVAMGLAGQVGATLGAEAARCPGEAEGYAPALIISAAIAGAIAYLVVVVFRAIERSAHNARSWQ